MFKGLILFFLILAAGSVFAAGPNFNDITIKPVTANSAGNVGIGTTAPRNLLDVNGTASGAAGIYLNAAVPGSTTNTLYNSGGSLYWNGSAVGGSGSGTVSSGTSGYFTYYPSTGTTVDDQSLLYTDGTNIGIGTTLPKMRLDIPGYSTANSQLRVGNIEYQTYASNNVTFGDNVYYDGASFRYRNNGYAVQFYMYNGMFEVRTVPSGTAGSAASPTQHFIVTNDGNVGIGGNQDQNSLTGSVLTVLNAGNVGIGTILPLAKLHIAGDAIAPNAMSITGSDLFVKGNIEFDGKIYGDGSALTGLAIGSGTVNSGAAGFFAYYPSAGTAVSSHSALYTNGTNVGIGTSLPNNKIHVAGLINFNDAEFNTLLGYRTGLRLVNGAQYNVFVGYESGMSGAATTLAADNNTAVGYWTLYSNTSGNENTAMGNQSLKNNTTGALNTAYGSAALFNNTTGGNNTVSGYGALYSNSGGSYNAANGTYAAFFSTGSNNTAFGTSSLYSNKAGSNATAIGYQAMYYANNTTTPFTNYNVAVGYEALRGSETAANNIGNNNTALGYVSLWSDTSGGSNTGNGYAALYSNTTGSNNVALGYEAGRYQSNGSTALTDPENSVYIGYAAKGKDNSDSNSIVIGYDATGLGANSVVLGNNSITTTVLKGNVGIGSTNPVSPLNVASTLSTSGGYGGYFATTGAGSSDLGAGTKLRSFYSLLAAGYTGNSGTSAMEFVNLTAGTGTNPFSGTGRANYGLLGDSRASTNGTNVGAYLQGIQGKKNYGIIGLAPLSLNSPTDNIGVLGFALGATNNVGGFFSLFENTEPTFESAALIADNAAQTSPIFLARDNGTKVFVINDGGNVGIGTTVPVALLDVDGSIYGNTARFGGNSNYSEFEADGTLKMVGDATVWNDLVVPGLMVRTQGSSDPTLDIFQTPIRAYAFADGASNEVFLSFQMSHTYKEGTDIHPHVHFSPNNTNTGSVRWCIDYTWSNINAAMPASTTSCVNTAASGTQFDHQIGSLGTITGTGKMISSVLVARLYREGGNGADTYNDKAFLLSVDIHYEADTEGSRTTLAK
jgi:hypothetical protein